MVTVITHEMHTWQINLSSTRRTPCNVKHLRVIRIREFIDQLEFIFRFEAVGVNPFLVLEERN
jgi:hypothetical protein